MDSVTTLAYSYSLGVLLTLLIECRKKFPLTETALFFTLDFLLMMCLLDVLVSE